MQIYDDLLTINEWSRPGRKLASVRSVILHWTGNPNASAKANRDYFESRKKGTLGYGSAHYIIGLEGEILRCVPDDEVAYHCGSSQIDPVSKRVYTDWARNMFGSYAAKNSSPNNVTIGIEMCVIDSVGNFTAQTLASGCELVASLCMSYNLSPDKIGTHNLVVGWKDCPRLWTNKPELFQDFKIAVGERIR